MSNQANRAGPNFFREGFALRLFYFACCLLPVACCLADDTAPAIAQTRDCESPNPATAADRWFVSIITQANCEPCAKLKADFADAAKPLHTLADETTLQFFEIERPENGRHWRWRKFDGYPSIVIQPPKSGRAGDPVAGAIQITGYDGDAAKLAATIRAAAGIPPPEVKPDPEPPQPAPLDRPLDRIRRPKPKPDTPSPPGATRREPLRWLLSWFTTPVQRVTQFLNFLSVMQWLGVLLFAGIVFRVWTGGRAKPAK